MSRPNDVDREAPPTDARTPDSGTPRWVKVFALVALLVVVLFVVLALTGRGGGHGPGRHAALVAQLASP